MKKKIRQQNLIFSEPVPQKKKISKAFQNFKNLGQILKIQIQRENIEAIKQKAKKILKKS